MAKKIATKSRVKYVCSACGYESPAFLGRCPECDAWGTLVETVSLPETPVADDARGGAFAALPVGMQRPEPLAAISREGFRRIAPGDRRGEPRARRRARAGFARAGRRRSRYRQIHAGAASRGATRASKHGPVLYVSAEESPQQIKLRAERLNVAQEDLYVIAETDIETILAHAAALQPKLVVVDSIQTVALDSDRPRLRGA